MMENLYWRLLLVAVFSSAGCTPSNSTIRPPYVLEGAEFDESQLHALAIARCAATSQTVPEHSFTTDGCTMWPDDSWLSCCIEHDLRYWCGGTEANREEADQGLRSCMSGEHHKIAGATMYFGVRAFGHPLWPFSWRWGYGRAWPSLYRSE